MKIRLPTVCRWFFAVCTAVSAIGAGLVVTMMLFGLLAAEGSFGKHFSARISTGITMSPAAEALLLKSNGEAGRIYITGMTAVISDQDAKPLRLQAQTYGLPLTLIYTIFFVVLFDLLRRLFRNVEQGQSFTPRTVRQVQTIGILLIAFSLLSTLAEDLQSAAILHYIRTHDVLSGTGVRWMENGGASQWRFSFQFDRPVFFAGFLAGLLVLALAEVFRQGLALKRENDLTV